MEHIPEYYTTVIEEYLRTGSVKTTARNLSVNITKVRRILITEGLWHSQSSDAVRECLHKGMTTEEIAKNLHYSIKTVQSYLPYTRGFYGLEPSGNAKRSLRYRGRMKQVKEKMTHRNQETMKGEYPMSAHDPIDYHSNDNQQENNNAIKGDLDTVWELVLRNVPAVLLLRLELDGSCVDEIDPECPQSSMWKNEMLRHHAGVRHSISREVLVPGNITLHALNYVIQRIFGWQNSHLHHFSLPKQVFQECTNGGRMKEYGDLCGILFRFPDEDYDDQYWDDDYEEGESVKTWFRRKYRAPYSYYGYGEWYRYQREQMDYVNRCYEKMEVKESIRDYLERTKDQKKEWEDENGIIHFSTSRTEQPRTLKICSIQDITLEEAENSIVFMGDFNHVLERLPLYEVMRTNEVKPVSLSVWKKGVGLLNYSLMRKATEELEEKECPVMIPLTKELIYNYDYGDGWKVNITGITSYEKEVMDSNSEVLDEDPLLEACRKVITKRMPLCIDADGLNVLDDVGGLHGFCEMLETIHGEDPEEALEMKEWARWLGWTGRVTKPENML